MKLTMDMLEAYDRCPLMYKRMYVDQEEYGNTWAQVQRDCMRATVREDLTARINGGPGRTIEDLLLFHDKMLEEQLLMMDAATRPSSKAAYKRQMHYNMQRYLTQEAPLLKPEKIGVVVRRQVNPDLELECEIDSLHEREFMMVEIDFWRTAKRVMINRPSMMFGCLITDIHNTSMVHLVLRNGIAPIKFGIYYQPEQMVWFERVVMGMVEAIGKQAFQPCMMYRGSCSRTVCPYYFGCRGAGA